MIFFANTEGSITKVIQEPLYQGSLANRVILLAPFKGAQVTVAFTLPNGLKTTVDLMQPNMQEQDISGLLGANGAVYSAWSYTLSQAITQYAGKLLVQFYVYFATGEILATYTSEMTIQRGVAPVLPTEPTQDVYQTIITLLTNLQAGLENTIIIVNELPTENILENTIYALVGGEIVEFYAYLDGVGWAEVGRKAIQVVESESEATITNTFYRLGNAEDLYYRGESETLYRVLTNVDYTTLNDSIESNTQAIATNTQAITSNATNISNNTEAIAENKEDIEANAEAIATNAEDIAKNAQDIVSCNAKADEAIAKANEAKTTANNAVTTANNALGKIELIAKPFIPKGSVDGVADLPVPSAENLGWVYSVKYDFVTNDYFLDGAGISVHGGTNVAVIEPETGVYKYDIYTGAGGSVDLTDIETNISNNASAIQANASAIATNAEAIATNTNNIATNTSDISTLQTELSDLIADLNYKEISITSFTNNAGTQEMGATVTSVTLSWSFSRTPESVTLDGTAKAVNSTGETLIGLSITSNKSWTLRATDERDYTASRTTSISFLNGVYYGVATAPATYDSAFILTLTKNLRSSKLTSFSVTAGEGQYIYYCIPTRFGTASFKVGGFDGGFSLVATISFTNTSGYAENYYIYKSDNANLGATSVSVS